MLHRGAQIDWPARNSRITGRRRFPFRVSEFTRTVFVFQRKGLVIQLRIGDPQNFQTYFWVFIFVGFKFLGFLFFFVAFVDYKNMNGYEKAEVQNDTDTKRTPS